jgi:hypothetical protein
MRLRNFLAIWGAMAILGKIIMEVNIFTLSKALKLKQGQNAVTL